MLALALLTTLLLHPSSAFAQASRQTQYTVWASVMFNRIGERTPDVLGTLPTTLTSLGAHQSYDAGSFFKNRYLTPGGSALIHDMSSSMIDTEKLYVLALDSQSSVASAQAFLQGLYPPFTLNGSTPATLLDPTSISSNSSYIPNPLNGYQYPQIHVAGPLDPNYIYIGGSYDCPAFDNAAQAYYVTPNFTATQAASKSVYETVGAALLGDVLPPTGWDYINAYAIYDYVSYLAAHNASVAALLKEPRMIDPVTNMSYLTTLRWLADKQQFAQLSNMTAYDNVSQSAVLPYNTPGSISTIAGNLLAAKMLSQLEMNIRSAGRFFKLSLLFGDFEPLVSLFALMSLQHPGTNFTGIPQYASSAVFELYSWANTTNVTYPDPDSLYVSFHFRNGSDNGTNFLSYPAFNRGPSQTDMAWADFRDLMFNIELSSVGDWCTQCGAINLFCAAWNSSISSSALGTSRTTPSGSKQLSPAAAGAIGAVVALLVAALLFAIAMLAGGVRFHRVARRRASDLGGFKGGQKMASDRDLTIPKGGAVVGATVERDHAHEQMHERVGSWEMKDKARLDRDDDERRLEDPFQDPVKPVERV